ncbi:hypothetical protein BaRGS_00028427, partial [Batillaria attramentaria]
FSGREVNALLIEEPIAFTRGIPCDVTPTSPLGDDDPKWHLRSSNVATTRLAAICRPNFRRKLCQNRIPSGISRFLLQCGYGSFPRLPSFDSSFAPRPRRVSAHCKFYNFGATSTMFEALECVFSEYNFTPKASSPGVVES